MVGTTRSHLGAGSELAQESRGGDQEFPLLCGQGIRLVHRFPPAPSASVEEEQVHQEERVGAQAVNRMLGHKRQRKDFPQLPLPQ